MRASRQHIVYYTAFATDFAYFAFLFATTRLLAETGASLWHLGIFGASTSVSYALSGPLAGAVSDRWGRRRLILTGVIATILVLAVCSWWTSRKLYYVMAAAGGVAVALIYPPMIAWLTEEAHDTSKRLYRFCLAWNFGVISAQTTGGWLFSVHPSLPMIVAIIPMLGVAVLILSWRANRGPKTEANPPAESRRHRDSPRAMTFVYLAWLSNVAGAFAFSLIVYLFPYLAHESGISPPVHGAMLAFNRLVVVATYSVMYRFPFWRYRLWTALASQACAMAGLLLLSFGGSVPVLAAGLGLAALMLGYNYFASIYYSTIAFGSQQKGMASGVHEASLALGGGAGALGGGLIGWVHGSRTPYKLCVVVLFGFVLIELVIYLRSRKGWPRSPAEGS